MSLVRRAIQTLQDIDLTVQVIYSTAHCRTSNVIDKKPEKIPIDATKFAKGGPLPPLP